jgi:hypothetical protein
MANLADSILNNTVLSKTVLIEFGPDLMLREACAMLARRSVLLGASNRILGDAPTFG